MKDIFSIWLSLWGCELTVILEFFWTSLCSSTMTWINGVISLQYLCVKSAYRSSLLFWYSILHVKQIFREGRGVHFRNDCSLIVLPELKKYPNKNHPFHPLVWILICRRRHIHNWVSENSSLSLHGDMLPLSSPKTCLLRFVEFQHHCCRRAAQYC